MPRLYGPEQAQAKALPTSALYIGSLLKGLDASMRQLFVLLSSDQGQDIAEYAVMVAVILIIVVGTVRLIGSNSNTVFSQVGSAIG